MKFSSWIFKFWPLSNFSAITLPWATYFKKPADEVDVKTLTHEAIHRSQINTLGVFRFYSQYAAEFLWNFAKYRDAKRAYREISFEKEAYGEE